MPVKTSSPKILPTNVYFAEIRKKLNKVTDEKKLLKTIADTPFYNVANAITLDLGVVVLLKVNSVTKMIDRVALSNTEQARGAVEMSEKPFKDIKIPLNHKTNTIANAISKQKFQITSDWKYLFVPDMSAQAARFNQAGAGIGCSVVYPLAAGNGGALIFSFYQPSTEITTKHHEFMDFYSKLVDSRLSKKTHSKAAA